MNEVFKQLAGLVSLEFVGRISSGAYKLLALDMLSDEDFLTIGRIMQRVIDKALESGEVKVKDEQTDILKVFEDHLLKKNESKTPES